MYRLIFLNGRMKGRRIAVQQGTLEIGRDPQCQVDLSDDDEVSRRHAVIEDRKDGYYLRDLGSLNPPEVNGESCTERKLNHGDKIEVGRTQFEFQLIVEQPVVSTKRRLGPLQVTAILVIAALLIGEVLFVVVFPMWQKSTDTEMAALTTNEPARVRKPPEEPSPLPVPAVSNSPEVVRARDLLNEVVATQTNVPVEVFTSPVPVAATLPVTNVPVAPTAFPTIVIAPPVNDVRPAPATNAASIVIAPEKPEPPPPPAEDPVLAMVKSMMAEAARKASAGDLAQADQTYDRVQVMAPDFLQAYVERAKLYEKRTMYRLAGEQWTQVLNRSAGTPIYALAAEARQRVARLEIADREQKAHEAEKPKPAAAATSQKPLRIASVDRERFQGTKDYDEMRVLRINMRARATDPVEAGDVRVQVVFYDRNAGDDRVVPTRAIVPEAPLRVEGRWGPGETRTVTATYTVPRDFRAEEFRVIKQRRVYEGYRIRVFYKGELQDEEAQPKALEELPAPRLPIERPAADEPVPR